MSSFNSHGSVHFGGNEVSHSHPFWLSVPDEHWRARSLTHLQWCRWAPNGQYGSAIQLQDPELGGERVLPRGQVDVPVHLQSPPYSDNPDGHCGWVFFSQEHRPKKSSTGVKPNGQVDCVANGPIHWQSSDSVAPWAHMGPIHWIWVVYTYMSKLQHRYTIPHYSHECY